MDVLPDPPIPSMNASPSMERTGGRHDVDAGLWHALGRSEIAASTEIYHRHGAAAYAVARALTGDPEQAEQAVAAAFVELRAHAAVGGPTRPLRVEVLDCSRRCAGRLTAATRLTGRRQAPGGYRSMSPEVRDVLALAIAGGCGATEIVAIMGLDRATVNRDLLGGMRIAVAASRSRPPPGRPPQRSSRK